MDGSRCPISQTCADPFLSRAETISFDVNATADRLAASLGVDPAHLAWPDHRSKEVGIDARSAFSDCVVIFIEFASGVSVGMVAATE
jgi:hypothetical protein